jgi:uncharacterized membrane protein
MFDFLSRHQTRINYLVFSLIIAQAILAIYGLLTLPGRIPTHFNLSGRADGWGSPTTLLVFPGLSLLLDFLFRLNRHIPAELMNFPGPRTPDNITRQMDNIGQMMLVFRLFVAGLFLIFQTQMLRVATEARPILPIWFMLIFIGVMLGMPVVFVVRAYRLAAQP